MLAAGVMPNLAALAGAGSLRRMTSVHPWVSSVAWTTLQTGVNPGKHGIYGFVDRDPATLKTYVPLANRIRYPAVWDRLGHVNRRVAILNVPVTYPAGPVNGLLVSGFLAPRLNEKSVYPSSLLGVLADLGYRIDTDPTLARQSRDRALVDIADALERRLGVFLHLIEREEWDLFLGVVMETDRLHHFFYEAMETSHPIYAPAFFEVYRRIDGFIGQVRERLGERDVLMLVSDHGFCSIRREVYYNHWLAEAGYLRLDAGGGLEVMRADSLAYALDPARLFLNLRGRERDGRVAAGGEYERLRDELIEAAERLVTPDTGERVVERAYRREDVYSGPCLDAAADVVLAPRDGFDPKGALRKEAFARQPDTIVGMHTYDDAFLYVGGREVPDRPVSILDVAPTILALLDQPLPTDLDGVPLL